MLYIPSIDGDKYCDLLVRLVKKKDNITGHIQEWWTINQTLKFHRKDQKESLEIIVFSDKVSPPSLGFLAGYG